MLKFITAAVMFRAWLNDSREISINKAYTMPVLFLKNPVFSPASCLNSRSVKNTTSETRLRIAMARNFGPLEFTAPKSGIKTGNNK